MNREYVSFQKRACICPPASIPCLSITLPLRPNALDASMHTTHQSIVQSVHTHTRAHTHTRDKIPLSAAVAIRPFYLLTPLSWNSPKLTHLFPSLCLPQAPLPSAMASLCLAVLAFLLMAFRFPGAAGSATSIGVAAPDGLLLPSSKCPSPDVIVSTVARCWQEVGGAITHLHGTYHPD